MITPATAALALSAAKTVIKLAGRLDRLLAEKVSLQSSLTLVLPPVRFGVGGAVIKRRLVDFLKNTPPGSPGDLLANRRAELESALASGDLEAMERFFKLLFPAEALDLTLSPDQALLDYLRSSAPSLRATLPASVNTRKDPAVSDAHAYLDSAQLLAAFQVEPGSDDRQLGYPVRIGLLVADVLAEFGAENAQRLVRDDGLRSLLESVVTRFAEPDLETFDHWSPFLRHTLKSTLNGALDARGALRGMTPWVDALFDALSAARTAAGDKGDDFLIGLFNGQGYPLLISSGLAQAAAVLNADKDAPAFNRIVAGFLETAAPLVRPGTQFETFFNEHWGDLLRAGLQATAQHGGKLLEGSSPLLQRILVTSITTLSEVRGTRFLTRETLVQIAEGVIGAVATHPDLWDDEIRDPWLRELLASLVGTVQQLGVRSALTADGARTLLQNAAAHFAQHPEWLVGSNSPLFQSLVGGVLKRISEVPLPSAHAGTLASAAMEGALAAITENSRLIELPYADTLAAFAGFIAARVNTGDLAPHYGAAILHAATQAALLNPEIFSNPRKPLATTLTQAVLRAAAGPHGTLLSGGNAVDLARQLFHAFAARGRRTVEAGTLPALEERLVVVLEAALAEASSALGDGLTLNQVPSTLAAVLSDWLRQADPNAPPPALATVLSNRTQSFDA